MSFTNGGVLGATASFFDYQNTNHLEVFQPILKSFASDEQDLESILKQPAKDYSQQVQKSFIEKGCYYEAMVWHICVGGSFGEIRNRRLALTIALYEAMAQNWSKIFVEPKPKEFQAEFDGAKELRPYQQVKEMAKLFEGFGTNLDNYDCFAKFAAAALGKLKRIHNLQNFLPIG